MKPIEQTQHDDGILFPALEQNMMAVVLIDEKDRVLFFNAAAEKLWGYDKGDVLGKNVSMLVPHSLRSKHSGYIQHNRKGGEPRVVGMSRDLLLEKKDGSIIWSRFSLSKVNTQGKIYYLALARDVSAEVEQREQKRLLIIAVDHIDRPVVVLDVRRRIVQFNQSFTEMFGFRLNEATGQLPDTLLRFSAQPADNLLRMQQMLWQGRRDQGEFLIYNRAGEQIWVKASINPVLDAEGNLQNLVMTFSDITEDRQIRELELNVLAAMCSTLTFEEVGNIICHNIESVIKDAHVSLYTLTNNIPQRWASSSDKKLSHKSTGHLLTLRQKDGTETGRLIIRFVPGRETRAFIERVADISQHLAALALEQENSRQRIEHLIMFDPLTGLPNRNSLHDYLDHPRASAEHWSPVLFLINVDHFYEAIDSHGYAEAEHALLKVVNRICNRLRPGQFLSRTDSTKFVLVSDDNNVDSIIQQAEELRAAVALPVQVNDAEIALSLSIGISHEAGKHRDYLLSTAHYAMDYIRKTGGNGWQFFNQEMNQKATERQQMSAALKRAITDNRLRLVYQPQILTDSGALYGFEALLRWNDPIHGEVPPSRFIPLAEEVGEIENIGQWVFREACRQLAEWNSMSLAIPTISVNLSALHFRSNQLPDQVSHALEEFAIKGEQIIVEMTESMMMEQNEEIIGRIQRLRDMGVGLSIDDFGTGFSGLSKLVTLPVTEIKIDRSFVEQSLKEERIRFLLESITRIGQSFNLNVVAEGVENKEQLQLLRKLHCPVIQGYFYSRPLPADQIPEWYHAVLPGYADLPGE